MKVILTEKQIDSLLQAEGVARLLQESLGESKNLENLKKIVLRLIAAGIAATTIIAAINKVNAPSWEKEKLRQMVLARQDNAEKIDTVFEKKVNACREYMEYALKNQNFTLNSTGLKPETLVKASMERGFDLPFLMAVAHQERCFGATPRARRTNSVFSEGAWDDGSDRVKYSDPNDSVYGYIDLLNNSYLVNGKTLLDLLKPGSFVNGIGKRYATDKAYEQKINSIRKRILKKYPELA